MRRPPNVLTIAGSDSGGGAGIQADLKTMTVLGAYGMSVITALTAQNGLGVTGIHAPDPDFVKLQMQAVFAGFPVHAAKTGMLFSSGIIAVVAEIVAEELKKHAPDKRFPLVVDPVCVSQSGHRLLEKDAVDALKSHILPLADLLTPNRPEAELLAGMSIHNPDDVAEAGRRLLGMGAKAVLIKGGHFDDKPILVTDWFMEPGRDPIPLRQPHVDTTNNHGTGCTLSAAIATWLGFGMPLKIAITKAQEYLNTALRHAYAPGQGSGPPYHNMGMGNK